MTENLKSLHENENSVRWLVVLVTVLWKKVAWKRK